MKPTVSLILFFLALVSPARALERPWISDVFFYWYTWDYDNELGSWMGGIHNTPLSGYYDSRTFRDNRRSLWQASEWGMTHHFMDYWSPDWKGEDGQMREAVVMRAAESLRKEGYDIWMSYYQDGSNFAMREFSRNVSERRDVHQWLRDFAGSEVWPKIDGEPLQLVYSRNGRPETTIDHAGFRQFLRDRYGDVAALNREWQTGFAGFDEIEMDFGTTGHQRAASIEYQYLVWQREWQKLNGLVKSEFGYPGMRASFDVGYGPFENFGFARFARVFGGPHSYGGIFDQPHAQDAERFIQAAVAKKYNTVFFDHFKNYYHDWDIRVPGMAYLPDPFHFDRFWVGALARHSEALLHLSWNEWWEGSNLEPCREFGKTYCEKNLFYSTLMQLAFDSTHTAGQDAPVAVLLNDWRFASGGPHAEELHRTIQTLRRLGVPFDLVPDDFVAAERLERFRLVVAPAYGCGLGYNERREPVLDVLAAWLAGGDRRLIVSGHPSIAEKLELKEAEPPAPADAKPGDDLNLFVDVGAEGDEEFLRSGYSGRETGMRSGDDVTFRWTPATGSTTTLVLPSSPHRDHVLRLRGNTMWPNTLSLVVNGSQVESLQIPAGQVAVDAEVPEAAIGPAPMVALRLRYAKMHVPGKIVPERHAGESRVCNLSLNWLQWSTANVPAGQREQNYRVAEDSIRLTGSLFGGQGQTAVPVPFSPRPSLASPGMEVLSESAIARVPRDVVVYVGPSQALYVNGPLSEIEAEAYWLPVLKRWANVDFDRFAIGEHCMPARLYAGDTELIVAFNEEITEPCELELSVPARDVPLSEAVVLSRDGRSYEPLEVTRGLSQSSRSENGTVPFRHPDGSRWQARDTLAYYGVYQFAFAPVRIETPRLALQPGESRDFTVKMTNLTDEPVQGRISAKSVIPTVSGEPAQVELGPRATKSVPMRIAAAPTVDWGKKTVYFQLDFAGRRAVVLRELIVQKPTEVELAGAILDPSGPELELRVPENPYGEMAALTGAKLTLRGQTVAVPETQEGGSSRAVLPPLDLPPATGPGLDVAKLGIEFGPADLRRSTELQVFLARRPGEFARQSDARAVLVVYNARTSSLDQDLVTVEVPAGIGPCSVRAEDGSPVPCQAAPGGRLAFLATARPRSASLFYLCSDVGHVSNVPTDLRCTAQALGTGKGTVEVENSHLAVVLSEATGGTVTRLVSRKTNRDYAHRSLGIDYGTFSRHDPTHPQTNTVEYIHEKKTRQEDSPGRIDLISRGPAAVVARVSWADPKVRLEQVYEFHAGKPYFILRQKVEPIDLAGEQELAAVNARFRANRLTKTYPNFVGVVNDQEQPHFGWRTGSWVPDYATLMAPNDFDESLSLVITRHRGLVGIRQGFWPAERPKPGKCEAAQIELLGDPATGCDAEVYVLVHAGHQIVAKRFLKDLRDPPRADVIENPRWKDEAAP